MPSGRSDLGNASIQAFLSDDWKLCQQGTLTRLTVYLFTQCLHWITFSVVKTISSTQNLWVTYNLYAVCVRAAPCDHQ